MKLEGLHVWVRLFCLVMVFSLLIGTALAEPADTTENTIKQIELSTAYPAIVAKAGDSLTFPIDLDNQSGESQDFTLSIESIPEGWSGSFSASGKQISMVHVKDENVNDEVSFALEVPAEAADGDYTVGLKAVGQGFEDEMEISVTLSAEEVGESSFEVEYPSQEGDSETNFSFTATLVNNTLASQSYSFAANAPAGWQVSFMPSGETTKVAALDVESRASQGLTISVTPPENVAADTYEIPCMATSASERMEATLSVTITGSYDLTLSTPSGRLSFDANANKESAVQLSLINSGNTDLTNVNLTSNAPEGWTVRFDNETIDLIEAGATVETIAYITPGEDAMSGDYVTEITARNSDTSSLAQFRVTVKTETTWGFVGIGAIVLLAIVVFLIMRRYGRR